jgi:hypothetical protein
MNEIVAQARAQLSAIAEECSTGLAEAQARMDRAHAEAQRNSEAVKAASERTASTLTKDRVKVNGAYPEESFAFGPDPDADEAARAPQQAPVPSPPSGRRPVTGDDHAEDEPGPRIFNEESW